MEFETDFGAMYTMVDERTDWLVHRPNVDTRDDLDCSVEVTSFFSGIDTHEFEGEDVVCVDAQMKSFENDLPQIESRVCLYMNADEAQQMGLKLLACAGELRNL